MAKYHHLTHFKALPLGDTSPVFLEDVPDPGFALLHGALGQLLDLADWGNQPFIPWIHMEYPLVNIQKAIENGHRNSEFSH